MLKCDRKKFHDGHEIIEGVSFDHMIKRIEKLFDIISIKKYHTRRHMLIQL